jgi:hypothetical protein
MKQITFAPSIQIQARTIEDLRTTVIDFLTKHGMHRASAETYTSCGRREIYISPSCSNNDFTRALALFQLLFSEDSFKCGEAYLSYRSDESWTMRLTTSNIPDTIRHIEAHSEILISQ